MLDEQKQKATEAIQKAKRTSTDREVSAQTPMISRSRSQSRNDRPRITRTNLSTLNETEVDEDATLNRAPRSPTHPSPRSNRTPSRAHKHSHTLSQSQFPRQPRTPGAFEDSSFGDGFENAHAPSFEHPHLSDTGHDHEDFDKGDHIDDTLLDIT